MVEEAFKNVEKIQTYKFEYKSSIDTRNLNIGLGKMSIWLSYLLKHQLFVQELNSAFTLLSCSMSNIIISMLQCTLKTCKAVLQTSKHSKFYITLELFILGLEYVIDSINKDKNLSDLFLKFDKFITENISNFVKIIVTKKSQTLTPLMINNYFDKHLSLSSRNLNIEYTLILSLLIGNSKNTPNNILYLQLSNDKHFIPYLYFCINQNQNIIY